MKTRPTGYQNQHMTLQAATSHFLGQTVDAAVLNASEDDDAAAREVLRLLRTFHEGAFWVCWRIVKEIDAGRFSQKQILTVLNEILAAHAEARDISEGKGTELEH